MSDKTSQHKQADKGKWEKFAETQQEQDAAIEETVDESAMEHDSNLGLEFPDRQKLESQLTDMEKLLAAEKEKSLRLAAQMKNAQERSEREINRAHKYGAEKLLTDLLPVLDSLSQGIESAVTGGNQNETMLQGMQLTLDLLINTLQKHGVEVLTPELGDVFDPEVHEAMTMVEHPDAAPNTIRQVLQAGYALNGRVLRAARVIVAK